MIGEIIIEKITDIVANVTQTDRNLKTLRGDNSNKKNVDQFRAITLLILRTDFGYSMAQATKAMNVSRTLALKVSYNITINSTLLKKCYVLIKKEFNLKQPVKKDSKQSTYDSAYMKIAFVLADLSKAKRAKVGCVIVKDKTIISDGFNGMPTGYSNYCEIDKDTSRPHVQCAEFNALMKITRSTNASVGSTIYCTTAPCLTCAKMIVSANIVRVVYVEKYRLKEGLDHLILSGIECEQIKM